MKFIISLLFITSLLNCTQRNSNTSMNLNYAWPSLNFLSMDSVTLLKTKDISGGRPIVFFLLSPECPFCNELTKEITLNISDMQEIRIYMVSPYPYSDLKKYYNQNQLYKYKNVTLVQDYELSFIKYFDVKSVPFTIVYSKEKNFVKLFTNKPSIEEIKKYCTVNI